MTSCFVYRVPYAGQFSVGCHLTAHATLTTKERALPRWRAETDDSIWQGGVDEGAETSKNAAKPPDDSAPTPFVKRDTNRRASLGTPGSMGTPGSLTKWTSGDFFARISGGGGDVSSPNGDVASPNGPPTPSSPSSPRVCLAGLRRRRRVRRRRGQHPDDHRRPQSAPLAPTIRQRLVLALGLREKRRGGCRLQAVPSAFDTRCRNR